jgi:hypothetical protein
MKKLLHVPISAILVSYYEDIEKFYLKSISAQENKDENSDS